MASRVIGDMRSDNRHTREVATGAYYQLTEDVIKACGATALDTRRRQPGVFSASSTSEMLRQGLRVKGFLDAIHRTKHIKTAIDAGCGASGILAFGIITLHEGSEVIGCDINEESVYCARAMAELLGLSDYAKFTNADVSQVDPEEADLGVSDTFMQALFLENGHVIANKLMRSCREVIPAKAALYALDETSPYPHYTERLTRYPQVGLVDFSQVSDEFKGKFVASKRGQRFPWVYARYIDRRGETVIGPEHRAVIGSPMVLGEIGVAKKGQIINFRYKLGSDPTIDQPKLWLTDAA